MGAIALDREQPSTAPTAGSGRAALLGALFANSRDASLVVGEGGTIVFAASAVGTLLGKEPSSLAGDSVFDYVHHDDVEAAADLFERRLTFEGSDLGKFIRVRHASRGWIEVTVTMSLLPDPAIGICVLTLFGSEDASERELLLHRLVAVAEYVNRLSVDLAAAVEPADGMARIEQSLGEVALLTGATAAGLFVERRDGRSVEPICEWHATGVDGVGDVDLTRCGRTLQELLCRHVVIDDVDAPDAELRLPGMAAGRPLGILATPFESGLARGSLVLARRDSDTGWWESDSVLAHNVANLLARALRTTWSDELLSRTYELGPVGFSIRTIDGALVDCNQRYLDLYGITRAEATTKSLFDVMLPEYHETVRELHAKFLDDEIDRFVVEVEVRRGDGSTIWVRSNVVPMSVPGSPDRFVLTAIEDITETKVHRLALEHAAAHDSLTGLANRATLHTSIEQEVAATGQLPGLMLIDLDDFKQVNDQLGHSAGDHVLRVVAQRLVSAVRQSDLVARLGGDEFAIVLPTLGPADVDAVAERMQRAVEQPIEFDGRTISPTMSMGVAFGTDGVDMDDLSNKADLALYAAKDAGRRCYRIFDASMRH